MSLPTIVTPKHELTLPMSGKKIVYRPFLVKEQKVLMLASESSDFKQMVMSMQDVIDACVDGKLDVKSLPSVDFEYLFLHLRAKSVGELIELNAKCEECEQTSPFEVDLGEIEIVNKDVATTVKISDDVWIEFKYPSLKTVLNQSSTPTDEMGFEDIMNLMVECMKNIVQGEDSYDCSTYKTEELQEFLENLPESSFKSITEFFGNLPKMQLEKQWKCSSCQHENSLMLDKLPDFF